jgi:hypothetical protein
MSLKFKDEIDSATFDNLMEEDGNVVYELSCLVSNIKKEVVVVLDSFLSFLKKYEERKKSLCLHLLVMNKVRQLLKNMTKNLCFLCFLNVIIICIHWLNLKGVLLNKG